MITIRQATSLDLLMIAQLALLYSEEANGHDNFPFDLEHAMSNASVTIADSSGCFLLAFKDGELVGFLWGHARALPWSKAKLAFDTILYVRPEQRKTSIAFRLMVAWEEWARSSNCAEIQISIASGIHEDSSTSFFKKMGYHYIGQQYRKEL